VSSAGPYASLHLAPDRQPRQHPTAQFFTGQVPFLPPNQQRQSTEGISRAQAQFQIKVGATDVAAVRPIPPRNRPTSTVKKKKSLLYFGCNFSGWYNFGKIIKKFLPASVTFQS